MCKIYEIEYYVSDDQFDEVETVLKEYNHGYNCYRTCVKRDCDYGLTDLKRCARSNSRRSALSSKNQKFQKKVIDL